MIHTLSISLTDLPEAQALRALIEDLGYTVELHSKGGTRRDETAPVQEWRSSRVLLSAMHEDRTYTVEDLQIVLEAAGYKPQSASPLCSHLVRAGALRRVSAGLFRKEKKDA